MEKITFFAIAVLFIILLFDWDVYFLVHVW